MSKTNWLVVMFTFDVVIWLAGWNAEHYPWRWSWKRSYHVRGDEACVRDSKFKKNHVGGRMMAEKLQDVSDIEVSDVDVFRDTSLRYLGKLWIYFKMVTGEESQQLLISSRQPFQTSLIKAECTAVCSYSYKWLFRLFINLSKHNRFGELYYFIAKFSNFLKIHQELVYMRSC